MSFMSWAIIGAILGWMASIIDNRGPIHVTGDVTLGMIGGLFGGFLAVSLIGLVDIVSHVPPESVFAALLGGIFVLVMIHIAVRRNPYV